MADRYFSEFPISQDPISQNPISQNSARLVGPEAHHLIHVMRAKPGTRVVLFDGSGSEFPARVERIDRTEVLLAVLCRREIDREPATQLILGVALPKGDRQRWLVEKTVELGVARIVPLLTERSVARPVPQVLERLRRTVIEASKQCGRNRLMEIDRPQPWADYVAGAGHSACRLLAHPQEHPGSAVSLSAVDATGPVFVAVGPEGGFTDEEVVLAVAAGWRTIDLGPRILRVETAAILLAAMAARPVSV